MAFRDLLSRLNPFRPRASTPDPSDDFWYHQAGSVSHAGIAVRPDNAMAVSTVFACVRRLAETLACLPFRVYRHTGDREKEQARDSYLWPTIHDRPNRWQTPFEWRDMGMCHLALRGDFFCEKILDEEGQLELIPLNPDRVKVEQLASRRLRYIHSPQNGPPRTLLQEQIYHVRGMSLNGLRGVSILEFARNAVGGTIAQEQYGSALFANGGLPTFWIERPTGAKWTVDARRNFREGWRAIHAGPKNAGNPPILEDGMRLNELGLTSRDSQWIEARKFSALEICRFFGVPPHMVGIMEGSPYNAVEQQSLNFAIYTLLPWCVRWEQSGNRDLVDDPQCYLKLAIEGLLRGDMLSRAEAHNIAIQGGWETVNEAREMEDRNPVEGGDKVRFPLNSQPAGGSADWNQQGGQPGKGKPQDAEQAADDGESTAYEKRRAKRRGASEEQEGLQIANCKMQIANCRAAFGPLLEEAAARIAAAEVRLVAPRAEHAATDPAQWNAWLDGQYEKHRGYCESVLTPIAAAWSAATGENIVCEATRQKMQAADLAQVLTNHLATAAIRDAGRAVNIAAAWATQRRHEVYRTLSANFFKEVPT